MPNIVEFRGVEKSFGRKRVLAGASVAIEEGETITIIGGSGTGKSVFLKLLLDVLSPDVGAIFFRGRDVSKMGEDGVMKMRSRIGMLFQGAALFDSMTVFDNIAYPLREHFNLGDGDMKKIVADKLSMVGLEGIEGMMPADLSGGMKKRVGLARAIAVDPEVILYDEPTTGLDPGNTRRICKLIKELQRRLRVTSIVVTHDMEAAFEVSDRIAMLYEGRFAFIGTTQDAKVSRDPIVQNFIRGEIGA